VGVTPADLETDIAMGDEMTGMGAPEPVPGADLGTTGQQPGAAVAPATPGAPG
jgi:hypothetical protein